jgi:Tat protein secretion system quality control protein TatD with DNase activity
MASRFVDAHSHLHLADADAAIARAVAGGVSAMAACAVAPEDWDALERLAMRAPSAIIPSFGVHPWRATSLLLSPAARDADAGSADLPPSALAAVDAAVRAGAAAAAQLPPGGGASDGAQAPRCAAPSDAAEPPGAQPPPPPAQAPSLLPDRRLLERLARILLAHPGAGVGEIGLDRSRRGLAASPWAAQCVTVATQLALAAALGRPVSVHCVSAQGALIALLEAHGDLRGELSGGEGSGAGGVMGGETAVLAVPAAPALPPRQGGKAPQRQARDAPTHPPPGVLGGLLLHSWGGSPGAASQLRAWAEARGVPLVFSFVGTLATSAGAAFSAMEERNEGGGGGVSSTAAGGGVDGARARSSSAGAGDACACGAAPSGTALLPADAPTTQSALAGAGEGGGTAHLPPRAPPSASRDTLKSLAALPTHCLAFETDAPDQEFAHALPRT